MPIQLLRSSDQKPWAEVRFKINYLKTGETETRIHSFRFPYKDEDGVNVTEVSLSTADNSTESLMRCYKEIIQHALLYNLRTIIIPLFPDREHTIMSRKQILYAASLAYSEEYSKRYLSVYLLDEEFSSEEQSILSIADYISKTYVEPGLPFERYSITSESKDLWAESTVLFSKEPDLDDDLLQDDDLIPEVDQTIVSYSADYAPPSELYDEDLMTRFDPVRGFFHMDESFGETVLRLIREKGLTDSQCYNKANITRAAFYKIRQSARDPESTYRPSKQTALALAVALELNLEEAADLLERAGYAFSHSNKGDIIVEYFLINHKYNLFELNEVLYHYDQPLLGSVT